MPAPERNRWTEWLEIAKERRESLRYQFNEWVTACREEPVLIWETPLVRYGTYATAGVIAILCLRFATGLLVPAGAGAVAKRAETASFHVVCSNSACGKHFVIERAFSFDRFPVTCPFCQQETGQRALRCRSKICLGKMVTVVKRDGRYHCTECGQPIGGP
jgi:hypothetical protein